MNKQELIQFVRFVSNSGLKQENKKELYNMMAARLFIIRTRHDKNIELMAEYNKEKRKIIPNPLKIRKLTDTIISNDRDAHRVMTKINDNIEKIGFDKVFDVASSYPGVLAMKSEVEPEMENYWEDIENELFQNSFISTIHKDRETEAGDRKYLSNMIIHQEVREKALDHPERGFAAEEKHMYKETVDPSFEKENEKSNSFNLNTIAEDIIFGKTYTKNEGLDLVEKNGLQGYIMLTKALREDRDIAMAVLKKDQAAVRYIPKSLIMRKSFSNDVKKEAPSAYESVKNRIKFVREEQGLDGPG